MRYTIRFRLVLLDAGNAQRLAYRLTATDDGRTMFTGWESYLPIPVPLDSVEVHDLPEQYRTTAMRVTIGPVQEATGESRLEAFNQMLAAARALRNTGEFVMVAGAPRR